METVSVWETSLLASKTKGISRGVGVGGCSAAIFASQWSFISYIKTIHDKQCMVNAGGIEDCLVHDSQTIATLYFRDLLNWKTLQFRFTAEDEDGSRSLWRYFGTSFWSSGQPPNSTKKHLWGLTSGWRLAFCPGRFSTSSRIMMPVAFFKPSGNLVEASGWAWAPPSASKAHRRRWSTLWKGSNCKILSRSSWPNILPFGVLPHSFWDSHDYVFPFTKTVFFNANYDF